MERLAGQKIHNRESLIGLGQRNTAASAVTFAHKMKNYPTKWMTGDFDAMSWHDNVVHGIRIRNPDDETYDFDLVLDIDYILKWAPIGGFFKFFVAPAALAFHGVTALKFSFGLSFKESIQINGVDREEITTEPEKKAGFRKWRFQIHLHYEQRDAITFESTGFTQKLTKAPVLIEHQWLEDVGR